jgi:hypothetical protein
VRRARILALLLLTAASAAFCGSVAAQSESRSRANVDPDRLGMTCTQILQMSSSDWTAKFADVNSSSQEAQMRAIRVYGQCYDERTNRLASTLGRSGKGPLMGARGDFGDFENALKDFTAKAFAVSSPPADPVKIAYAGLYEKQFRYAFYESYAEKPAKLALHSSSASARKASAADTQSSSPATLQPGTAESHSASTPDSTNPLTRAKNRFGELLGALPEDKIHEVHAAFENVMVAHPIDTATELAVYRYAIFVFEPPPPPANSAAGKHGPPNPFSPPPF